MDKAYQSPEIVKNDNSPTGYFVTFRYMDKNAQKVGLMGDWMFSDIHHSSHWDSARIWPEQWKKGLFPHTLLGLKKTPEDLTSGKDQTKINPMMFEFDWDILKLGLYEMKKTEREGLFEYTLPLPSGVFNYRFVLDMPDGNPLKMVTVTDPANPPFTIGGKVQPYSQVYVPFDGQRQIIDRGVELPMEDGGRLEVFAYDTDTAFGVGEKQQAVIYLPGDYDSQQASCPVLYLSHGGGDNAACWVNQGALKNIMDHLIGEGRTKPMAVVMMDNEVFHWDNAGKCIPNLTKYLIPWTEKNYAVGGAANRRAFAGFSAGGFLAYEVMASCPELFNYIGVWSGGKRVADLPDKSKNPNLQVHIGAGRYDDAFFTFGYKLEDLLHELEIPFTSDFPNGGHQWAVWRQILEDFVGRVLWK